MDVKTWTSDNLIKLLGASDATTVDFVIATANSAKSASQLNAKLSDFLDGSSSAIQKFGDALYDRLDKNKARAGGSKSGHTNDRRDSKPVSNAEPRKKYALVDMEDDESALGPTRVKEQRTEHKRSRKDRDNGASRQSNGDRKHDRSQDRDDQPRLRKIRRRNPESFEDRWADQDPSEEDEDMSKDKEFERDGEDADAPPEELGEDAETRDKREREEFEKRLRDKDKAKLKSKDAESGAGTSRRKLEEAGLSMKDIRETSRRAYLGKRERERLALFRQQVAEEAEEERNNPRLSKQELEEFRHNREILALAEARLQVDDHVDGYAMPEDYITEKNKIDRKRKEQVLNERYVERDKYGHEVFISEVDQWEAEQSAKAKAQVKRPDRDRVDDEFEFVFDDTQKINFVMDAMMNDDKRMTPEQRQMQQKIDAAEQAAKTLEETRKNLPVYQYRKVFLDAVREYQCLVIVGETGSGKTTQLTQYLVEDGIVGGRTGKKVACTQPRRVAAMSVAKRVSEEMGVRLGEEVGYSIRFEDKTSPKTVIHYQTDGHLLKTMQTDPELSEYGCIMIDEAHERTLQTDILLALLKDLARFRPDLKLLISSATLDAQKFRDYFEEGELQVPILKIPGRAHPVEIHYTPQPESNAHAAAITTIFQIHLTQPLNGDILVFLEGQEQIERMEEALTETSRKLGNKAKELVVCPIYSTLDSALQAKIFEPTPPNCRKVVLATNIAETSITIDGIVYVIDTGFVKENVYSAKTRMSSLIVTPCSRAASNQRAGRAGRSRKGYCFRLYTKGAFMTELTEQTTPEILRENLSSTVLLLKSLGIHDLVQFDLLDPPSPDALIASLEELYALGALSDKGELTKLGRQMAEVPLSPSESRALIAAGELGCTEEVVAILAMLGESASLFLKPKERRMMADAAHRRFAQVGGTEGGDHWVLLNIWQQWVDSDFSYIFAKDNYLQQRSLTRARDVRDQILQMCDRIEVPVASAGISNIPVILQALTRGFFMNCARASGDAYRTVKTNMGVHLHPSSILREEKPPPRWLVFHEIQLTSKEFMRSCFPVKPEWLTEAAPHFFKRGELEKRDPRERMPKGQGAAPESARK